MRANAVFGLFPANSIGDDIEVYAEENVKTQLTVFHTLRQQMRLKDGKPNLSLADYIAPKSSGRTDYIGAFALTAGIGAGELSEKFAAENDDYRSIMTKALADRLAEAFSRNLRIFQTVTNVLSQRPRKTGILP